MTGAQAPGSRAPASAARPSAAAAADSVQPATEGETLVLRLQGFEGPLDLLLELARSQKVDLAQISILALVEQYLALVETARSLRLELAADWLVMAAWLTWLKSRLLLPEAPPDEEGAEPSAALLAARLQELAAMRAAAAWLGARPQLGIDVFGRGAPEDHTATDRSRLAADLPALLRAYVDSIRRGAAKAVYRPRQLSFWTVQDALQRLHATLGSLPGWAFLERFLPAHVSGQERRAAVASTLLASLELARSGTLRLRQDAPFAPILLSGAPGGAAPTEPGQVQGETAREKPERMGRSRDQSGRGESGHEDSSRQQSGQEDSGQEDSSREEGQGALQPNPEAHGTSDGEGSDGGG